MSGQTLSHYELLEKIGEGGMGVIFKARDVKLDRLVALKFLSPAFRAAQESVSSFLHEARALSKLNHPNIATIYEVEEEGDQPFLALEYLPGGTVKERIREARANGGTLPVQQVVDYALLIARALAHAHRHGIVHRDVKPDNALLTAEGTVKLTDFGVAQVAGRDSQPSAEMTLGTAAYMSPEQAQDQVSRLIIGRTFSLSASCFSSWRPGSRRFPVLTRRSSSTTSLTPTLLP